MPYQGEVLPTIKVLNKKKQIEVIINEKDFDPAIHTKLDEEDDDNGREQELTGLKMAQLRELADQYGLEVKGSKTQLIARITEYEEKE